jgi:hypothetical protein
MGRVVYVGGEVERSASQSASAVTQKPVRRSVEGGLRGDLSARREAREVPPTDAYLILHAMRGLGKSLHRVAPCNHETGR